MANEHLSFLRNLSLKISRAVANYAGSSLSNKPAILRKRYVSAGNEEGYDVGKDYKYSPGLKVAETAPVETVRDTSKRAYITLMTEYLKFNASRSVSVSTVRDQCEHFVNRVRQIKESMNKLVFNNRCFGGHTAFCVPSFCTSAVGSHYGKCVDCAGGNSVAHDPLCFAWHRLWCCPGTA